MNKYQKEVNKNLRVYIKEKTVFIFKSLHKRGDLYFKMDDGYKVLTYRAIHRTIKMEIKNKMEAHKNEQ